MVTVYCPEELPLLVGLGNPHSHCPRVRAATKSVLVHVVMNHLTGLLEKDGMLGIKLTRTMHLHCISLTVCIDKQHFNVEMFLFACARCV